MRHPFPLTRAVRAASMAFAVAALLAGCGPADPGNAERPPSTAAPVDPLEPPDPIDRPAWPASYEDFPRRADGSPTFTRDVAPILYEHCVPCHRPGGGGPFPLRTYDEARRRGTEIATVTKMRFMPPWLPERGHGGPFVGERGLTAEQVGILQQWIFEGMERGDPGDLPPEPRFVDGWEHGEPDLVVRFERPYSLPPGGSDVFRTFVIPSPGSGERWVRGWEFRAENPEVVHHATIEVDRTGSARRLEEVDPEPGFSGMRAEGAHMPDGHFVGWVPGRRPTRLPDGMAWGLTPETDLVVQLHMLPSGKVEPVQPELGLYFADGPPTETPMMIRLGKRLIDIPAGESAYEIADGYRLPVDVEVRSLFPHAHYLGQDLKGFATLPDGTKRWLVWVRDWDFNWQDEYRFREPLVLPAGTTLAMRFTFDNSASNIQNPNDPPLRVRYGPSTFDEMGDLWIQVVPRRARDRETLRQHYAAFDRDRNLARYRELVARDPDDPAARNELGNRLMRAGRPVDALASFREAVRVDPDYLPAVRNLGITLLNARAYDEAVLQFERVLATEPRDAETHANLGTALAMSGRIDEAVPSFREAIAIRETFPRARYQLARALEFRHEDAAALEQYRVAARQQPDWPAPWVAEAWIEATRPGLVDPESAVEAAERAWTLTGGADPVVLETLAAAYAAAGRFDEAVTSAERALALLSARGLDRRGPRVRAALDRYRRGVPFTSAPGDTGA